MNSTTKVLVTGTGSLIGQAIIKSIYKSVLRKEITLVGCDYFDNTVGSFWCDKNYHLPDVLKAEMENEWKQTIYKIVDEEKIRIIFVGVDFELTLFSEMKEDLLNRYNCHVVVSDKNVIEIGNDKYNTYLFLMENALNAPKTMLLDEAQADRWNFPVVVKPRVGARSRGVKLIKSYGEYSQYAEELYGKGYILQEVIGNMETEYTCGVLYWDGKFQNSIVLRRYLKEGNTSIAEYNDNKENKIVDYIRKIGDALKPTGSCNLQLRTDESGDPYLFEINPRFSGTTYMRTLFGYNEVEYIIYKVLGLSGAKMNPIEGKAYRFYEEKLIR
ncbi:ATP-grasp domain-containing protein [bacterium 1XD8-76]|nr:ATP-grasp domain-containing protein [bacterium 1XD8-76]